MVEPLRHRQTKGAETDMPGLPPPRHFPTLPVYREDVEDFHAGLHANERQPLRRRAVGVELPIRVASVGSCDNRNVIRGGL